MTKQEAIKIINCYDIGFYDLSGEKIPAEKLVEAFDMAIEALTAEPTERQNDVIKKPRTVRYKLHNPIEYVSIEFDEEEEALSANCTTKNANDEVEQKNDVVVEPTDLIIRADVIEAVEDGMCTFYDCDVLDRINAVPSADRPSGEWIPCSERLPKEKARVLTYDSMGDIVFGQYDKGRWYWEAEACADYWAKNDGVIAWMPLPKPYCPNCGAKMGSDTR